MTADELTGRPASPDRLQGNGFRLQHVMGMPISIDVRDQVAQDRPGQVERLFERCFAWLHEVDGMFSLWRPDTAMARLNSGRTTLVDAPREVLEVLRLCARYSARTDGLFSARRPDGAVDPTGLVKGWAVARIGRLLLDAGLRHWCINAAGDVLVHGQARPGEGWAVGISDPFDRGRLMDTLNLTAGAVATSGTGERGSHIWDPASGGRAEGLRAATVVARDMVRADAVATAAVARGADACRWLETFGGVQGLVVRADGAVEATRRWPGSPAGSTLGAIETGPEASRG